MWMNPKENNYEFRIPQWINEITDIHEYNDRSSGLLCSVPLPSLKGNLVPDGSALVYSSFSTMWKGQTQTVEEAIAFIRDKFADMGNDLVLVNKKLVTELGNLYGTEIFHLHERYEEVETKINKMAASLKELYEERGKLMTSIDEQIKMSTSLKSIEKMLHPRIQEDEDVKLLEMLALHYKFLWTGIDDTSEAQEEVKSNGILTPVTAWFVSSIKNLGYIANSTLSPPIVMDEPEQVISFRPVSPKQFDGVPALVKRRAKLEQVNELYKLLFDIAVQRRKCLPIKFKDISTRGVQVFGQTGSSKLATLRYLKLVEINNRDESVTILDDRIASLTKNIKNRNGR